MLTLDVLPDIEFGPVGNREHAKVLAGLQAGVKQRPELRALSLGLPLAEAVAVRKDTLLGSGFFFVAARAADQRVEAELVDCFQQRHRLVHIARLAGMRQAHGAALHRVFDVAHDQFGPEFFCAQITEIDHFLEVVAGIYHQQRIGDTADTKSFFRTPEHDQRVFTA